MSWLEKTIFDLFCSLVSWTRFQPLYSVVTRSCLKPSNLNLESRREGWDGPSAVQKLRSIVWEVLHCLRGLFDSYPNSRVACPLRMLSTPRTAFAPYMEFADTEVKEGMFTRCLRRACLCCSKTCLCSRQLIMQPRCAHFYPQIPV